MKENYFIQEILLDLTYTQLLQGMYIPTFNNVYIYSSNPYK